MVITWFVQLLGPLLDPPDAIRQLAPTSRCGQPMVGVWDGAGIAASFVIAIGGVTLGTWGFSRRDMRA